jgi:HPt (histidine-containing phosphotransfer) domain-containing protein
MGLKNERPADGPKIPSEVFDRAHLARYTMDSADLEREIIGLFLLQLPSTIEMIEAASTQADWKLATHTLKGAAASIGAKRIQTIAIELEALPLNEGCNYRLLHVDALKTAVAEFIEAVRPITS